jgi:hypothetical protein
MESPLLDRTPVIGWDFALVEELSRQGIETDKSREYLNRALEKAREEPDRSTEARIRELLTTLNAR